MGVKSAESLVPRDPGGSFVIRLRTALCTVPGCNKAGNEVPMRISARPNPLER